MCPLGLCSLEASGRVPTPGLEKGLDVLQSQCASWVMGSALSFFALFLFICTARSQATSWLIDKGGFDVPVEGKEDEAITPPVPSPDLSELMMNLSERRFGTFPIRPPFTTSLSKSSVKRK